jgi:hypothetical protein
MPRVSKISKVPAATLSASKKRRVPLQVLDTCKDSSALAPTTDLTLLSPHCDQEQPIARSQKVLLNRTLITAPRKRARPAIIDIAEEISTGSMEGKDAALTWSKPLHLSVKGSHSKRSMMQSPVLSSSTTKASSSPEISQSIPPPLKRSLASAFAATDGQEAESPHGPVSTHNTGISESLASSCLKRPMFNGLMDTTEKNCSSWTILQMLQSRTGNCLCGLMCTNTRCKQRAEWLTQLGGTLSSQATAIPVAGIFPPILGQSEMLSRDGWITNLKRLGTPTSGLATSLKRPILTRPASPTPVSSSQETLVLSPTDSQTESLLNEAMSEKEKKMILDSVHQFQ